MTTTDIDDIHGYVNTAVETLTKEMDCQFKELRKDMNERFDEVLKAIKEHSHG